MSDEWGQIRRDVLATARRTHYQTEALARIDRGRGSDQVDDSDPGTGRASQIRGETVRAFALAYIQRFRDVNGFPPTVREIATHIGRSASTTQEHLNILRQEGRISGKARTLRVLPEGVD